MTTAKLKRRGRIALAVGLLLATAGPGWAEDAPYGLVWLPPVMASRAAPLRRALVVAPGGNRMASNSDTAAYRDTLRLLGFEVALVTASTRPELDAALRAVSAPVTGDLAVFLVGRLVPNGRDLFLLPADAEPTKAPVLATEGLRLKSLVQRLLPQAVGEVVVVAQGCRDRPEGASCANSLGDLPAGVSLASIADGEDGEGSAHDLVPLMRQEGMAFDDLVAALRSRSAASGQKIVASAPLSHTFTFLPTGFLAGLPLACNDTNPAMSADALRGAPPLGALVAACEEAARRYDFSPFFKTRLAIVREQRVAQSAFGCEGVAAAAYLQAYPEGRYRKAVAAGQKACATLEPAPATPPVQPPNPLQAAATTAVADYFRRHNYDQGGSFGELVRLYPPKFRKGQAVVSRNDHLRDLGAWYGGYDSVRFEIVPDTLDASGCLHSEDCLVRGTVRARTLKSGDDRYAWEEDRFVLRINLTTSLVLAECGVAGPTSTKPEACD